MKEHILLYEELNRADLKKRMAMDLSENRNEGSAFTSAVSKPYLTVEKCDTPIELQDTLKKYVNDGEVYQKLMKILVVAAMKYRVSAPVPGSLSERVYNF